MNPTVGDLIDGPPDHGRLRLTSPLGSGAFGIVFRAISESTGQTFAVKFLQSGLLASAEERRALANEIMAAKEVRHPNVIAVLYTHAGDDYTQPYVVSEFAEGGTLHDRIAAARTVNVPFPLEVVRRWTEELCSAMAAINAKVLHRDLKPDNILLVDDSLRVADFGLAKLVSEATRTVTFKGGQHILYMAPEGWQGRKNAIQLDMYSAGLILYEIGTLRYPYERPLDPTNLDGFRLMHLTQMPKSPHLVRPELPRRFSEVVLTLLAKRPESRYASWKEAANDLQLAFAPGESTSNENNPFIDRLLEAVHRRHQSSVAAKEAEAAEQQRRATEQMVDTAQRDEILVMLRSVVDTFNTKTAGPHAALTASGVNSFRLQFPYAVQGQVEFFPVSPPIALPPFQVRFAARVSDDLGCGFNLLLQRRPDEEFGTWVVCQNRFNPIASNRHPSCKYIAFQPSQMHEIQRGYRAMATYVPEISSDVEQVLRDFVSSLFSQSGPFRHS